MAYLTPFLSKISGKFTVNVPKLMKSMKLRGWVGGFTGLCQLSQIYPFFPLLFEILNGAGVSSTFTFKVFVEGEREKIAPNRSQKLLWKWSHLVWLYCILSKYRFLSFFPNIFPYFPLNLRVFLLHWNLTWKRKGQMVNFLSKHGKQWEFFVNIWETMGKPSAPTGGKRYPDTSSHRDFNCNLLKCRVEPFVVDHGELQWSLVATTPEKSSQAWQMTLKTENLFDKCLPWVKMTFAEERILESPQIGWNMI